MKKLLIGLSSLLVLLFNGCGALDSLTKVDGVAILYHYPAESCESPETITELKLIIPEAENISASVATNDVTCDTYNKTEGQDCTTKDYISSGGDNNTSCVIRFEVDVFDVADVLMDAQKSEDIALAAEFAMDAH